MELKRSSTLLAFKAPLLLIVPYGIETVILKYQSDTEGLLIVPYGIETASMNSHSIPHYLLIVPYGIETNSDIILCLGVGSFNRTLWN